MSTFEVVRFIIALIASIRILEANGLILATAAFPSHSGRHAGRTRWPTHTGLFAVA